MGKNQVNKRMNIRDNYLQLIKSGEKTLEIRVAYDRIKEINIGEVVEFCSESGTEMVRIIGIRNYTSFDELLSKEDPYKIIPGLSSREVESTLREIYPPHKESLGVVAFNIKLLNERQSQGRMLYN